MAVNSVAFPKKPWHFPWGWLLLCFLPWAIESFLISPQPSRPNVLSQSSSSSQSPSTRLAAAAESTWQSHVSTHPDAFNAFNKIYNKELSDTDKSQFDLAMLFVSQAHANDFEALVQHAHRQISSAPHGIRFVALLGGGVIGESVELDEPERPSMSLLIGSLPPGAQMKITTQDNTDDNNFLNNNDGIWDLVNDPLDGAPTKYNSCLLFADPWAQVEQFLAAPSQPDNKDRPLVLAGGITCPYLADQSSLAFDGRCLPQGSMIAIAFGGTLGLQTMVAQGCRPVTEGSIYRVTACDGNVITKLDGKPALQVLRDLANQSPPAEQDQISSGLLCGIMTPSDNTDDNDVNSSDFLSRQIMGFVPSVQGIAIGTNQIREGDLFCFQVRDGSTAQQDLQLMVQRAKTARLFDGNPSRQPQPVAAIQISCVARGRGMFDGIPNVDLSNVQQLVETTASRPRNGDKNDDNPPPVVAGFFANGEIGPVGLAGFSTTKASNGRAYLHSFTTVAATLCEYTQLAETSSASGGEESSLDAWG
ncbi:FIST [Seminavis robusta]|uniref:FIST n=1 Tax=Seminavis robusta TaxID=568900 RepID=A0A9N8E5D5_9STRA|nr:FIST [Seminavis robusta]|eukprot:Sro559_g166400.1 FIST (532) ;mRNA; r:14149-15744